MLKIFYRLATLTLFIAAGLIAVKVGFAILCWVGGHYSFEAMLAVTATLVLGTAVGLEAYLSFRAYRKDRNFSSGKTLGGN